MLQKTEPDAPAYRRIQYALQKRIEALAELQPGDAVPSERELARSYEVSLMTARHALAELEHQGLVDRRRGAGTFVALPKIHFNRLASFTEQMASRGCRSALADTLCRHCGRRAGSGRTVGAARA